MHAKHRKENGRLFDLSGEAISALNKLISIIAVFSLSCFAIAETFRYKDQHGNWVYTKQVPQEFLKNGYDVLGDDMRVMRQVPRAPTGAELVAKQKELAEQEQKRITEEKQKKSDEDLQRRFGTPAEIENAKQRKITELKGKVSILQGNLNGVHQEIENLQSDAAALEREGQSVPEKTLQKMVQLKESEVVTKKIIAEREEEINSVAATYDGFKKRFLEIRAYNQNKKEQNKKEQYKQEQHNKE